MEMRDEKDLGDAIADAVASETPLEVIAHGSRRHLARPVQTKRVLDLSALTGITLYEPEELVLTAKAATPLADIIAALESENQMLAFDPPLCHTDLHAMCNAAHAIHGTLGGIIATNLSGPRRLSAGAARDFILGFKAISGRGEAFQSGGRVVKNVTGYDLGKLMAGSFGTLGVMHEITIKTMPRYETAAALLIPAGDVIAAGEIVRSALAGAHEVTTAAILPAASAMRSRNKTLCGMGAIKKTIAAIRLEGIAESVKARGEALIAVMIAAGYAHRDLVILNAADADTIAAEIRERTLLEHHANRITWKITCPPAAGPELLTQLLKRPGCGGHADWGGGLLWVSMPPPTADGMTAIRKTTRDAHAEAMLYDAPDTMRRKFPPFTPPPPQIAALEKRIKAAFDPAAILNPGRMREEI